VPEKGGFANEKNVRLPTDPLGVTTNTLPTPETVGWKEREGTLGALAKTHPSHKCYVKKEKRERALPLPGASTQGGLVSKRQRKRNFKGLFSTLEFPWLKSVSLKEPSREKKERALQARDRTPENPHLSDEGGGGGEGRV